jgi:hypothetical protein
LGGANGEDSIDAEELVQMVEEGVTEYNRSQTIPLWTYPRPWSR